VTPAELSARAEAERRRLAARPHRIAVCTSASCLALGAGEVRRALRDEVDAAGLGARVEVHGTGCLGLCHAGPAVEVHGPGAPAGGHRCRCLYERVDGELARRIVREHVAAGAPVTARALPPDDPVLTRQLRIVTAGFGELDPESLDSALAAGAYAALARALGALSPAEVLGEVSASGLRGRGGAGYPTGLKWATVAKAPEGDKLVVCNADEGDPGAFMDRAVLEGDPHRVLEGMALAAYAVGAARGYVYVRGEYRLAIARLRAAIQAAEAAGLLGTRILGTSFSFPVELRIGAGAYVCGEETALLASVEGGRGTPRTRPPYPAERGAFGLPTLINNVETFANVPSIVARGGAWFAGIGTARSKGTKVLALSGDVRRSGVFEVAMGTPLREVIDGLGGGVEPGRTLKAAQTGGPSGGCIPARHLDLPVDYESLLDVGTYMGSGGLVVMDDRCCMVDVARFFLEFCRDESCGKCVPCRAGTVQLHEILERLCRGDGVPADVPRIEELARLLREASLCGLGQGAPGPILSTLRHFPDEVRAHAEGRACPAGVCDLGAGARPRPPQAAGGAP
jgi:bidirectional [NiFe] hydrogenase diaphorase subunit